MPKTVCRFAGLADMARTGDLFEGVFDNRATGRREVWRDGEMRRFARRNAVGTDETQWRELHAPWGHYPDLPANAGKQAA
jgi:hypothetical protein